ISKRAQHAGNVTQGRRLRATLLQRSRRLTLEIDDHEVVALRAQHLPEMIIAVNARAESRVVAYLLHDLLHPAEIVLAPLEERLRLRDTFLGQSFRLELTAE